MRVNPIIRKAVFYWDLKCHPKDAGHVEISAFTQKLLLLSHPAFSCLHYIALNIQLENLE